MLPYLWKLHSIPVPYIYIWSIYIYGNGYHRLWYHLYLIQQNFQKFMDGDESLDTTYLLQLNKYDKKGSMNKLYYAKL